MECGNKMICCCSLAGTDACKNCQNKSDSDGFNSMLHDAATFYKTNTVEIVQPQARYAIQYWCPKCSAKLSPFQKYCQNCAVLLDWEEYE